MIEAVESIHNSFIKMIASLQHKKYRDKEGLFIVEGVRLVEEAVKSNWQIAACLFTAKALENERVREVVKSLEDKEQSNSCRLLQVSENMFSKIAETEHPQGLLVVMKQKNFSYAEVFNGKNPLVVLLDGLQDPGNVGTVLRTADAAGATGIILSKGCADIYAGKTVRASMGSLFHLPILGNQASEDVLAEAQKIGASVVATKLSGTVYTKIDYCRPIILVLGNEGHGVSEDYIKGAASLITIPLYGQAESLNVSAAAAVLLYEAVRQRSLKEL